MPLNSGPRIRACVTNLATCIYIGIVKELRSITHITHEEQSQKVTGYIYPGRERTTKDRTIAGTLTQILKLIVFVCNCMKSLSISICAIFLDPRDSDGPDLQTVASSYQLRRELVY